ncbi:MAG: prepilin-type N-terminal cleavage/methylation domain-containing protein [Dehalococcoidia bacterium]
MRWIVGRSLLGGRSRGQKGFGLAETLVALAIMGTAVIAFLAALSTASMSLGTMGNQEVARNLASSQLEQTKAAAYLALPATYDTVAPPAGYSISVDALPVPGADDNIQLIRATVYRDGKAVLTIEDLKVNR